ncbi:MAG: hypothetical protein ABEJ72_08195, partial [Candidatus Aenigmatarchaeota archaeon]
KPYRFEQEVVDVSGGEGYVNIDFYPRLEGGEDVKVTVSSLEGKYYYTKKTHLRSLKGLEALLTKLYDSITELA